MSDPIVPPSTPVPFQERIENLNIERELQDSYLTYAMSTIIDRALPDVRDGLKPSQRRILVSMNDLNLRPGSKPLKCAKIAGNTSGDYHPHGEAIVYPTMVRMAQDWNLRYKLIDGQGNFGSTDGDPPAAMRYTEARPSHVEAEMLADLDMDTVDYIPNYDERLMEPTVLPGKFPNLLVNGSTGIAVGMACNLVPHNLREICRAIVKVLDNKDVTLAELMQDVVGPDFPTGGIICGKQGIIDGYSTGRGKLTLRCKLHVETAKNGRQSIIIDELPYNVIRKDILEDIKTSIGNDRIKDISGANDESGRLHKCRIVVDLKRDVDPDVVINQLYQYTPCQITVSIINIAIVNRQPRTMGLKELIQHFIAHRKEVIVRRTKFLLRKAKQRGHILEGLIFAVCDIDEIVRLIRTSKTRDEAIEKLRVRGFRIPLDHPYAPQIPEKLLARAQNDILLSQAQAEAIGRLQLIQLVGLEIERLTKEYREITAEIEGYELILSDERRVFDIIRDDTLAIMERYGDDRRTEIDEFAGGIVDMEALIQKEDVVVTVSHTGYVKRLPVGTYRAQSRGGRGIKGGETKDGDFVEHLFVANTHDYLLFFTNKGRVYERRVFDVPEMSRTSLGRAAANLMDFQPGEKIAQVLSITDFGKDEAYLVFATSRGVVKKTALTAYANILNKGIIAIGLEEGDTLIDVAVTQGEDEILLATKQGMSIRFNEKDVRPMGRPAGGVKGIDLSDVQPSDDKSPGRDEVVSMIVIPKDQGDKICMVLTGCENGYGKRTQVGEYRLQRRGGSGVINIKTTERNGNVVGMKAVCDEDELMLITQNGIIVRTRVSEIRETGRNAAGVKLINVDNGDMLVAMARVDREEEAIPGITEAEIEAPTDATTAPDAPAPGENEPPIDPTGA
ncbi:MAG TPA: DNA gyrase subunit A [Tepidisphaeraceae bacterium]|jgi:DNA gyrase subunit A